MGLWPGHAQSCCLPRQVPFVERYLRAKAAATASTSCDKRRHLMNTVGGGVSLKPTPAGIAGWAVEDWNRARMSHDAPQTDPCAGLRHRPFLGRAPLALPAPVCICARPQNEQFRACAAGSANSRVSHYPRSFQLFQACRLCVKSTGICSSLTNLGPLRDGLAVRPVR